MKNDCKELRKCCLYIRKWIKQQPSVKEESITDWLLFSISEKINKISYKAFSRNEEAKHTGADWEWWFIFNEYSYKMRVQAKKIKINKDNYASLAYTNKYGLQIDKLIQNSEEENFIPFYAFYTSKADNVRCRMGITDEGVYMAGGNNIYNKFILSGKKRINYDDILKESTPLSCFLCCPLGKKGMNRIGFLRFLAEYFSFENKKNKSNKNSNNYEYFLGQYEETPNYIQSFIKLKREGIPDSWEKEFQHEIKNINSLSVYDARD